MTEGSISVSRVADLLVMSGVGGKQCVTYLFTFFYTYFACEKERRRMRGIGMYGAVMDVTSTATEFPCATS